MSWAPLLICKWPSASDELVNVTQSQPIVEVVMAAIVEEKMAVYREMEDGADGRISNKELEDIHDR